MAKDQALPTLSMDGWIDNKESLVERLFIYFLAGDTFQSNTFVNTVYTLKECIQKSDDRNHPLEDLIVDYLSKLYSDFFPIVEPSVKIEEEDNRVHYIIELTVKDEEGKSYDMKRILQSRDNKIINLQELLYSYKVLKK